MLARSSLRSACSCVGRFSTAAAELACTSVSLPGPSTQPPKEPCPDCPSETLQNPPSHCSSSLPVLFAARQGSAHRRTYTTQASSPKDNGSIFSSSDSPWDHVFKDIQDLSPFAPSPLRMRHNRLSMSSQSKLAKAPRRQSITAREHSALNDMFDVVFSAASVEERLQSGVANTLSATGSIGRARSTDWGPFFSKIRRHSKRLKWTSEADEELDRKKEEMELCETDLQLLDWAMREVFGESQRYEAAARRAAEDPSRGEDPVELQPAAYPHLLALLMRTFRDKYADPHLALSMFDHARHLSIASFVFGCTTPAYNELIETRWRCFRDLRGVCDALEEMRVNGIGMDNRTRSLAEMIRREVGSRNLWQEESEMGSGEVWDMVSRIEKLTAPPAPRRRKVRDDSKTEKGSRKKWTPDQEGWKHRAQNDGARDGWEFGRWDDPAPLTPEEQESHTALHRPPIIV